MQRQYKKILALNSAFVDDYFRDYEQTDGERIEDVDNVIRIHGTIEARENFFTAIGVGTSNQYIQNRLAELYDAGVDEIILDIDSPGGAVEGTAETAEMIKLIKSEGVKIIAYVRDMAGSAAYWIASAANEIVASPTASVGSIGVIAVYYDQSEALQNAGIKQIAVVSENAPSKTMSDGFLAGVQNEVNAISQIFVEYVAEGRNVTKEKVESDFGKGVMINALEAKKIGMIDRVVLLNSLQKRETSNKMAEMKNDNQETLVVSEAPKILELCESIEEVKKIAIPLIQKNATAGEAALGLLEFRKQAIKTFETEKAEVPAIKSELVESELSEIEQIRKNAEMLAGVKK